MVLYWREEAQVVVGKDETDFPPALRCTGESFHNLDSGGVIWKPSGVYYESDSEWMIPRSYKPLLTEFQFCCLDFK